LIFLKYKKEKIATLKGHVMGQAHMIRGKIGLSPWAFFIHRTIYDESNCHDSFDMSD
jgi:hypothetical protein